MKPDATLEEQIEELARDIMQNYPGEPSRSEGAIETAIRLLRWSRERAKE